ncbi:MAG: hypothetical protein IJ793_02750 [Opitutales bacterium]|nr:hypothetical protein [Opitutales bacterium]
MKNEDLIVSVETMNRQLSHFGIFQAFATFGIAVLPFFEPTEWCCVGKAALDGRG